jgi:putative PIN family toxin of toxin-antitoxin system
VRPVLDTNVVIAGLLWHGAPRRLLDRVIDSEDIVLASRPVLLAELAHTLAYRKFSARIDRSGVSVDAWVQHYAALTMRVDPQGVSRVVEHDPDDDHVIACAITARADAIVSGDHHLTDIGSYQGIPIFSAREALAMIP